jgi:cytoskeletal protein RodZ
MAHTTVTVNETSQTMVVQETNESLTSDSPTVVLTDVEAGPQGPAGPTGATGADGSGSANTTVVHDQASANATWTMTHNLGRYPAIDIIDSAGNHVIGDIKHNSVNQAVATFDNAFAGKAIIV